MGTSEEQASEIRKERVLALALGEGIKGSVGTLIVATGATLFATYRYKKFDKLTNVSGKTAMPIMAALAMFALRYEIVMLDAMRHPENWGLEEYVEKGKVTNMPFHHKFMNAVYDKPFYLVAGMGIPAAGLILNEQMKLKHLTLSQKIMHSRVFAQGSVLSILLVTMLFREYMNKRGRFPEPTMDEED